MKKNIFLIIILVTLVFATQHFYNINSNEIKNKGKILNIEYSSLDNKEKAFRRVSSYIYINKITHRK